jgi:hypothetical protein
MQHITDFGDRICVDSNRSPVPDYLIVLGRGSASDNTEANAYAVSADCFRGLKNDRDWPKETTTLLYNMHDQRSTCFRAAADGKPSPKRCISDGDRKADVQPGEQSISTDCLNSFLQ